MIDVVEVLGYIVLFSLVFFSGYLFAGLMNGTSTEEDCELFDRAYEIGFNEGRQYERREEGE
jgi:hypothetical protein